MAKVIVVIKDNDIKVLGDLMRKSSFLVFSVCILLCSIIFLSSCTPTPTLTPLAADDLNYLGPRAYQYKKDISNENFVPTYIDNDIVKYKKLEYGDVIYYDTQTNAIVARTGWNWSSYVYNIYDADTLKLRFKLYGSLGVSDQNFANGKAFQIIEVSHPITNMTQKHTINIFNLLNGSLSSTFDIPFENYIFSPYAICGDVFMYTINDYIDSQYVKVNKFLNFATGQKNEIRGNLGEHVLVNEKENIIYIENNSNTYISHQSTLSFINPMTAKVFNTITLPSNHSWQYSDLALIGNGLMFNNNIFDATTGKLISNTALKSMYGKLLGFSAERTLYSDDNFDIVYGYHDRGKEIAIFSNQLNGYVFRTWGDFDVASNMNNGKYISFNINSFAIMDLNATDNVLEDNLFNELKIVTEDNIKAEKLCFLGKYTDAIVEGEFLYVALDNRVFAYRTDTLELKKTIEFTNTVTCLDAHKGILAVGFGYSNYLLANKNAFFAYANVDDGKINYVDSNKGIINIAVFNGKIYFSGRDYWDDIFEYDVSLSSSKKMNQSSFSQPFFSINKKDGILYVAESGISSSDLSYIDLTKNSSFGYPIIYESDFMQYGYNYFPVIYSGSYVHYYGYMLNSSDGSRAFDYARLFSANNGYIFLGSIYFDNRVSVFVAEKDGIKVTVVYDTVSNKTIEVEGDAERVIRQGDSLFIVRPNRDTLFRVSI